MLKVLLAFLLFPFSVPIALISIILLLLAGVIIGLASTMLLLFLLIGAFKIWIWFTVKIYGNK